MSENDVGPDAEREPSQEVSPGASARLVLATAKYLREAADEALAAADERRAAAQATYEAARDEIVHRQLAAMPIARLRETTVGGSGLAP